ncbi:Repeat of Unknown Function (DUF347) [Acididesulfobacillus acetoxydans]|uniref:TonB protein n=1 Tax=Acididesulfobacillus acetoxydans TaxID=1561005 RepID=A0A8S0XC49_9FIRM|nr:hypothetical protein [Acididesulfobacillus acetoxydans]CAA7602016.1 Repeat of Unknown Function (DUF347) [Acididesulfobacillus acetoxydans]CEJ08141.1 TonB protein [Acididesulfobacillus acetoxydans]
MRESLSVALQHKSRLVLKVPEVTLYFWIVKLLTTAMGEATSDYLVYHMNPYLAVILGGVGFIAALILQFAVRRYVAYVYWLLVVMVAVFGTMVADVTHIVLGVPYYASTITFAIVLMLVFFTWSRVEKTLSIHSICTRRREVFYWMTVLSTFAMGTATGDMTAVTFHWGYFSSGVIFTVLFLLPWLAYRLFGLNEIFVFWFAYVMTRPLGASFADWFGMPRTVGGLGYGKGLTSVVLTFFIVIFVVYLAITRKDVQPDLPAGDNGENKEELAAP